jgi:hypothetical protein
MHNSKSRLQIFWPDNANGLVYAEISLQLPRMLLLDQTVVAVLPTHVRCWAVNGLAGPRVGEPAALPNALINPTQGS